MEKLETSDKYTHTRRSLLLCINLRLTLQALWAAEFPSRNLLAFSVEPLLVFPTHYTGEVGYISDTEESLMLASDDDLLANSSAPADHQLVSRKGDADLEEAGEIGEPGDFLPAEEEYLPAEENFLPGDHAPASGMGKIGVSGFTKDEL